MRHRIRRYHKLKTVEIVQNVVGYFGDKLLFFKVEDGVFFIYFLFDQFDA